MSYGAWVIAKREIKSLFVSPIAYCVGGFYALLLGWRFLTAMSFFDAKLKEAKVQAQFMKNPDALQGFNLNEMLIGSVLSFGFFLLIFIIPAITMRFLAEEKNQTTYELLSTSPISAFDIVLGKFMAGVGWIIMLGLTHILFLVIMFGYGNPEPLPVLSGYLGSLLTGISLVAVGLFASSLTRYQIMAFIIALFLNFVLILIGLGASMTSGNLSIALREAAITTHFESFNRGLISASSLVYFITLTVFFLAITKVSVQSMNK